MPTTRDILFKSPLGKELRLADIHETGHLVHVVEIFLHSEFSLVLIYVGCEYLHTCAHPKRDIHMPLP